MRILCVPCRQAGTLAFLCGTGFENRLHELKLKNLRDERKANGTGGGSGSRATQEVVAAPEETVECTIVGE
jgi:hypothetical protein